MIRTSITVAVWLSLPSVVCAQRSALDGRIGFELRESRKDSLPFSLLLSTRREYSHTGYCLHTTQHDQGTALVVVLDSVTACSTMIGWAMSPAGALVSLPWRPGRSQARYRVVFAFGSNRDTVRLDWSRSGEYETIAIESTTTHLTAFPVYRTWLIVPTNSAWVNCVQLQLPAGVCAGFITAARVRSRVYSWDLASGQATMYASSPDPLTMALLVARDSSAFPLERFLAIAAQFTGLFSTEGNDNRDYRPFAQVELQTSQGERWFCRDGRCARQER